MFDWVLNVHLINYHSVLTLNSMLSFKLVSFDFSFKKAIHWLVKTIHCKMENDIGKYYHWYSQKNLQTFQQFQLPAVFSFHEWQYWISSGHSRQRRFCQLQINSPVMASLKIDAKLQENTLSKWDISIYHVPSVSCVNLLRQSLILMF